MTRLAIRDFESKDLPASAALLAARQKRDRARLPVLSAALESVDACEGLLASLLQNTRSSGVVSLAEGVVNGFHGGEKMTLADIIARVEAIGTRLVEITGGEPLIHGNAFVLAKQLLERGYTVLVETSGAIDVSPLDPRVHKIMDLKCPGSGEESRNLWANLDHLTERDEIKFVVKDRADYEWTRRVISEHGLDERVRTGKLRALLVSPVWDAIDFQQLAEWILQDHLPVRYQIQLHKVIWGANVAGV